TSPPACRPRSSATGPRPTAPPRARQTRTQRPSLARLRAAASIAIWIARSASASPDPIHKNEWPQTTAISRMVLVGGFRANESLARLGSYSGRNQLTPSFFCRLDDDVVYWNTSRLFG